MNILVWKALKLFQMFFIAILSWSKKQSTGMLYKGAARYINIEEFTVAKVSI